MSSLGRILSSRGNGARSTGPVTAEGERRSSQNATSHGLLARHIVIRDASPEGFEAVLSERLDRLQPADGMEFGLVEEMVASHWRFRRALAIETRLLENEAATQTAADPLDRIANAFADLAAKPALGLMHRYQTRLHLNYRRALHNMLLLRVATVPNEPSPISGHPGGAVLLPPHPIDKSYQRPAVMKRLSHLATLAALGALVCGATIVPRLSLEEMVAHSDVIVSGWVVRTWAAWDGQHRFIWTHSEIMVGDVVKGRRIESVVVSEPGGVVDGFGMQIAGTPRYSLGERVMVFLGRMPNGYLRTTGMGQGKLSISTNGSVHLTHVAADLVRTGHGPSGTALQSLDGGPAKEVRRRVVEFVYGGAERLR